MTKYDLIRSYDYFYHVTPLENAELIEKNGLQVHKYPDSMYDKAAPEKLSQICLAPQKKVKEHKESIIDKSPSKKVAVFRIPAQEIVVMKFGLDWTFDGTRGINNPNDMVSTLKNSIDFLGTLCVFENISADLLERIE